MTKLDVVDTVVVGAGPGGIAAAYALTRDDLPTRVVLVDVGRAHNHRPCPVDRGHECNGCGGVCNVISGFGGSMHYGDGVKLSLMPSGRRLIDLYGEDAYDLSLEAFELVSQYTSTRPPLVGHQVTDDVLGAFERHDLHLRQYPVAVLGESELARVLDGLSEDLSARVDLRLKTNVRNVVSTPHGYAVALATREGVEVVHTRNVILATGRRGLVDTQRLLRQLSVPMTPPDFSIGVRFEMAADYLRATGLSHPDMKVTQRNAHTDKVKTFCFCGGANGGRVKFTNYFGAFGGSIITLDGHETLERQHRGRALAGNFGLMCQTMRLDEGVEASSYLEREVLEPYRRLNGGRPVVQLLSDFRARRETRLAWRDLADRLPFDPTVRDLAVAPVHTLFTDHQLASLVTGFDKVMRPMLDLGGFDRTPEELDKQIIVIGLELEFLWSHVQVDETGETPRRGLFVVGDAAGIAQGVIQAMMMGLRAGTTVADRVTADEMQVA
jgi:uncharacterized FAD-dependent dehydrogenase